MKAVLGRLTEPRRSGTRMNFPKAMTCTTKRTIPPGPACITVPFCFVCLLDSRRSPKDMRHILCSQRARLDQIDRLSHTTDGEKDVVSEEL